MRTYLQRLPIAIASAGLFLASGARAADAKDEVFNAYQKLLGAKFAADVTTVSGGSTIKTHSEYDTVQRIHMKNDKMEMIVLPEGTWMRTGAQWTQPPMDMSGMVKQFFPQSAEEMRSMIKSATDSGATTWNGQPVHTYSYQVDTTVMGIHVNSTNKLFVDAGGQIVHVESDGEAMGRKSQTSQDIRYDDSIKVTPPK